MKLNLPEGDPADQAVHPSVCHTSQETEARDTQWMKVNLPEGDPADQAAVKVKVIRTDSLF